ncbi:MAG TPA: universal stress protein [Gemmataceae bacterium]|nr:universal stress protein [Pirellulales bacterium]HZZ78233.1 universal stress protein [Gemmataceae bacterium]
MGNVETTPLRDPAEIRFQAIGVATDFSETAGLALSYGAAVARQFESELHVLHVLHEPGFSALHPSFAACEELARAYFNKLKEGRAKGEGGHEDPAQEFLECVERETNDRLRALVSSPLLAGLHIQMAIRYGSPVDEISQYVRQNRIELLVLGTHGHTTINHFIIGSVAERVVRKSPCPVLTVRLPRP